jgi:sugar phosphate permease
MDERRRKWWIAGMLGCAAAINYADRAALSAVLAPLRSEMGLSDVALGSLGSFFLWSYALGSPLAGVLADRRSRSRIIVWSLASWSIVCGVTGLLHTLPQLLAARVLLGLTECLYLPAATALLAEHHGTGTRGMAMAIHSVGLNGGLIAGGTLVGFLADRFGWRPGFWVLGIFGLLMAGAASMVLRDAPTGGLSGGDRLSRPEPLPLFRSLSELVRIPSYVVLVFKAMLAGLGIWIFLNWLPLYYRETFQLNLAAAGFAGTFMLQAATMLGIAGGGWLSDLLAMRQRRNRIGLQSISYLLAAPVLLLFLARPGFAVVSGAVFLFSLLRGVGQSNENPALCDVVPPRLRSTAIGIMNTGATLAGGIGVLAAGYLKSGVGLNGVFAGISVLFVVAGAAMAAAFLTFAERDIERADAAGSRVDAAVSPRG